MLNTYSNMLSCKRSRDSLATVGALDGGLSDKRLRFSGKSYAPLLSSSVRPHLHTLAHSFFLDAGVTAVC